MKTRTNDAAEVGDMSVAAKNEFDVLLTGRSMHEYFCSQQLCCLRKIENLAAT